jgi:RNA polymerase-binding transcription factor DksA
MAKKTSQLSQKFLDEIKQELLEEKSHLETDLADFTTKNPKVTDDFEAKFPEYGDEEDENAREVAQYTVNKPLEISLENTLRDVNKSLERIDKGTYGICKYCKQPIDEKRLRARPTSSACVSCKKTLTDEV